MSNALEKNTLFAGRYLIEEVLGTGGFSSVYLATEIDLERLVALKVMLAHGASSEHFDVTKERFFREARYLSKLQEPQLIRLYHYGEAEQRRLFMALEYVDGVNLRELIRQEGALDTPRALHIVEQILLGLREVHSLGILHRDIKPNNVMVTERFGEEKVKLLDFGIAKSITQADDDLTRENAVIGTPRYLAPEQITGQPLSSATDIYAVGLLLYESCLGESPHDDTDLTTIFGRMQLFPSMIKEGALFSEPVRDFVLRCLHFSPDDRFSSVVEALDELRRVRSQLQQDRSVGRPEAGARPPQSVADDDTVIQESVGGRQVGAGGEGAAIATEQPATRPPPGETKTKATEGLPARWLKLVGVSALLLGVVAVMIVVGDFWPRPDTPPTDNATSVELEPPVEEKLELAEPVAIEESQQSVADAIEQAHTVQHNVGLAVQRKRSEETEASSSGDRRPSPPPRETRPSRAEARGAPTTDRAGTKPSSEARQLEMAPVDERDDDDEDDVVFQPIE